MNQLLLALFFRLLSPVSLPLGALTTQFWIPRERVPAALMAFGVGALLSALTIDLFGEKLEQGVFLSNATGAVIGPPGRRPPMGIVPRRGGGATE